MRAEKQKGLKLNNLSDSHTNKPQMLTDCYLYNGGYIKKPTSTVSQIYNIH